MRLLRQIALLFVLLFPILGKSQNRDVKTLTLKLEKYTLHFKAPFKDTGNFDFEKTKALNTFRLEGYAGITLKDSLVENQSITYSYVASKHFKAIQIKSEGGKNFVQTSNYFSAQKLLAQELNLLENTGYPFAKIEFTKDSSSKDQLFLTYKIDSGAHYILDKITLKCDSPIHENTILSLINIRAGDDYNESKIKRIDANLTASGFYNLLQAPQVVFRQNTAELFLFIRVKKASAADGYVGLQQNQTTGRIALNGYINLSLNNAFQRATTLDLNWRNNPDKTQLFKFDFDFPFLFNTPLGLGSKINLQKQDTSFTRSNIHLYLGYRNPIFQTAVFTEFEQSDLLVPFIPNFRSYKKNTFGLRATLKPMINDRFKFYQPNIFAEGGFFNYKEDTLQDATKNPLNLKLSAEFKQTIKFLKYFKLKNSLSFTTVSSPTTLSINELNYFGGLRTLRGFYELELVGNDIWILKNEMVFQPIEALSLMLLYDYSHFEMNGANFTHSAGVGFGLTAGNSILEIVIANGTLNNNPFLLSNTKVHIGFKSSF